MTKHRAFLCKYVRRRTLSTSPLPLEPQTPTLSSFFPLSQTTRGDMSLSLADQLINRGLFSSAQKVIQRLISQCSSIPEAISVADFAVTKGMDFDLRSYTCLIRKLVISGEPFMAEALYMDCIAGKGLEPDRRLLNCMIICFCKLGKLDEAKSCFDRLIELDFIPWVGASNAIIKSFCGQDRYIEGYDCFCEVVEDSEMVLDFSCYNRLVDGLCYRGFLDEGLHVFDVMRDHGFPPTIHLCKSLLINFCKWGRVLEAEILSMEIESYGFVLDMFTYTCLINAYCRGRKMKMAMRLFIRMLKMGYQPDNYTYNTLIHGFVNLGLFSKAWLLHDKMMDSGLKPDLVTYQIMLNKLCIDRNLDSAVMLLDDMIKCGITPNVHCYTTLISALCKEQRFDEVCRLYHKMLDGGVVPDHVLFFTLVKNHPKGDELYLALMILQAIAKQSCFVSHASIHANPKSTEDAMAQIEHLLEEIARSNCFPADVAFSVYLIALCVGGKLDDAWQCMENMVGYGLLPLLTPFNSLIKLLFQEGRVEDVGSLLKDMQDRGLVPNQTTFSIIVDGYCKQEDFFAAIDILDQIEERGIKPNVAIYTSIIGCLGRQRKICMAEDLFFRMLEVGVDPDETVFATMINAYSKNGWARKAEDLFEKMMECGMRPDSKAYTALLPGLVKKNKMEKCCTYLNRMLKQGFLPDTVLYTSLIKQFFRKREFEFALRLVNLMEKSQIDQDLVTYITYVSGVSRNIRVFNGKWFLSSGKLVMAKEMLFSLLHQETFLPTGTDLKVLISSQEEIKSFALEMIQRIQNVPYMQDIYLQNAVISVFCWAHKMQEAHDHLILMQQKGLHPNLVTYTILIEGHMLLGEADPAVGLFNEMNTTGLVPDGVLFNTLLRGLCRVGRLPDALSLSHTMQKRGIFPSKGSYESLLSSFCSYRSSVHALRIYEDMLARNYFPCRYNLDWLVDILWKDDMINEACDVRALMLKRRKFLNNANQILVLEAGREYLGKLA